MPILIGIIGLGFSALFVKWATAFLKEWQVSAIRIMSNPDGLGVYCQCAGESTRAFDAFQNPRDIGVIPEAKVTVEDLQQDAADWINADDTGLTFEHSPKENAS